MLGFSLWCEETTVLSFPTPSSEHCLAGFFTWLSPLLPWNSTSQITDQIHRGPNWINPIYFPFSYIFLIHQLVTFCYTLSKPLFFSVSL